MSLRIKNLAILSDVPRLYNCVEKLLPSISIQNIKPDSPEVLQRLNEAEVIIADFDKIADYVYQLKNTKWIQGTWAGVEPLIRQYQIRKELPSCPIARFSGEHFGAIMSEYVVAHVTSFERDMKTSWLAQQEKKWDLQGKVKNYRVFRDMEVGLLGGGQISIHIASVLKSLGARIWCLVRTIPAVNSPFVDEYRVTSQLDELLGSCDLIINVLPHSSSTTGLLSARNIQNCRESLFVNIGRGSVISESDLINALEKKYFRGAILDVFENEPLSPDSKLWSLPEVVITPHVAGLSRGKDIAEFFKKNLTLWEAEGKLLNIVNFEKGY